MVSNPTFDKTSLWVINCEAVALFLGGLGTGILLVDGLIDFFFCVAVIICVVALIDASTARLKIEQLFKYYWTVVSGLAAISLILAWFGL